MKIDPEALELLERRLAEKIESRVRGRLFKLYGTVGAVVLSIFSFFGYNIITGLEDQAKGYAQEVVASSVEDANAAADLARSLANEASARLEFIDDWMNQRTLKLAVIEDEVSITLAKVGKLTTDIESRVAELNTKVGDTETRIDDQQARSRDLFAGAGNVETLMADLATLTQHVEVLATQIGNLRPGDGDGSTTAQSDGDEKFLELAAKYSDLPSETEVLASPTTVYFQFAGVKREQVKALSSRLAERGYEMPGEERIASAAGLHEVRYFFDDDRDRAERLVAVLNQILDDSGYRADVTSEDVSSYKGAKPRPGTVELWLEPVRFR